MANDFYVYLHKKADSGQVFYVGKGSSVHNRPASTFGRNKWWRNTVKAHGFIYGIVKDGLSEEAAFNLERKLIKKYGRRDIGKGALVNLTDGGEGTSNPSPEVRAKISKASKGNKHTLGRVMPEYEKTARSISNIGKKRSVETRKKLSSARIGEGNGNYDPTVYKWVNKNGEVKFATKNEMDKFFNKRGRSGELINPDSGLLSYHGWFHDRVKKRKPNGSDKINGKNHPLYNPIVYVFFHKNGEQVSMDTQDFASYIGSTTSRVGEVVRGNRKTIYGWKFNGIAKEVV